MSRPWQPTKLAKALTPVSRPEAVDPTKEYRLLGVRLDGRGPFLRETITGSQSAATRLFKVEAGDFIYSRLFAWRGAFGVIDGPFDSCYVSGEFPTFRPIPGNIDTEFLRLWFRLPSTIERVEEDCSGSTPLTRNRFKENFFLDLEIPLPPLPEQQRIVARIEALATKIKEAQGLKRKVIGEHDGLCRSIIFNKSLSPFKLTPMRELVRPKEPDVIVQSDKTYQFAGVYCFGGGVFKGQRKSGMEFAYTHLTQLKAGNFVYPKLMAWEGALGIVPLDCDGLFVSPEFPVFEVDQNQVLPEVLDVYFRTPSIWPALAGASTGTNVRRRRLNPKDFLNYQMPLPPMPTQEKLAKVKTKAEAQKKLQSETAAELDALLPSILDKAFKGEL